MKYLKTTVKSPGSATIINAIATGCGSAFGIQLYVTAEVELKGDDNTISCSSDVKVDTTLMETCVEMVRDRFKNSYGLELDSGISVKTSSTLPVASGLSSSSATSNAVIMATVNAIMDQYEINADSNPITDFEMLNMGVDASLKAGVTITGAFDDASASFFGGFTITNNMERKIFEMDSMKEQHILVYMPNITSPTAHSDVSRMKLIAPQVKLAFQDALQGNLHNAMTLNGLLYCASLGFNPKMALDAIDAGAVASGLSGTGPSFVALAKDEDVDNIIEAWSSQPGKIIRTEVDNRGTRVIGGG